MTKPWKRLWPGVEDHLGALPNYLLCYLVSLLPSCGSVCTCALAKRWSTLWKSVPALCIDDPDSYDAVSGSSRFVNELLSLCDPTPLNVCDISSDCQETAADNTEWANEAFQHMKPCSGMLYHLKFNLHLDGMHFEGCSLNFSSCKVLEVLEMISCDLYANILSQSLRHLKIHGGSFGIDDRIRISTQNLIGFRIAPRWGWDPLLDSICHHRNCVTVAIHHVRDVMLKLVKHTIPWLWKVCQVLHISS
ncbi:hypothetical protein VPH35_113290 [Triticum aestivum]